ncbi:unnamed protein product [Sphenostylis stenocarpa]|uniref:Uncharacterized protein n=1 Tax=Sphenostylis stenocarpa TaxID=92480 RepID=A0AA86SU57_9FABA|nr:unnamed protein product [Sphenostylis stenocarpa]
MSNLSDIGEHLGYRTNSNKNPSDIGEHLGYRTNSNKKPSDIGEHLGYRTNSNKHPNPKPPHERHVDSLSHHLGYAAQPSKTIKKPDITAPNAKPTHETGLFSLLVLDSLRSIISSFLLSFSFMPYSPIHMFIEAGEKQNRQVSATLREFNTSSDFVLKRWETDVRSVEKGGDGGDDECVVAVKEEDRGGVDEGRRGWSWWNVWCHVRGGIRRSFAKV